MSLHEALKPYAVRVIKWSKQHIGLNEALKPYARLGL